MTWFHVLWTATEVIQYIEILQMPFQIGNTGEGINKPCKPLSAQVLYDSWSNRLCQYPLQKYKVAKYPFRNIVQFSPNVWHWPVSFYPAAFMEGRSMIAQNSELDSSETMCSAAFSVALNLS